MLILSALIINFHRPGSGSLASWSEGGALWGRRPGTEPDSRILTTDTKREPQTGWNPPLPMPGGAPTVLVFGEGI